MGATGEWQRGPVIGRGASATVSIAIDRRTGGLFAVKSVDMARAGLLQREQSVLSALSSPYVVSCLGADVSVAADGSGRMCCDLFLEYAPGGSLADEIKRCGGRCAEAVIRSRAADVLRGLAYVHGSGVAHCDVKSRNVLLRADGRAMLADFGCARWTADEDDVNAAGGVMVRGTPMFMSPEAARGEAQGEAADIWALGCTVIEMATGGAPWQQQRFADPVAALHHIAHSGDVPQHPSWLSDEAKDFLSRCLIRDPARRWSAEQLLQHPFVVGSSSSAKAAPVELRVSPKSALDLVQAFWEEDSDSDSDTTASLTPADRVRALAYDDVAADWTWSGEHWITVCGHAGINDDTAASPGFAAGARNSSITGVSEEQIGHASSHGHDDQVSSAVHVDADDADASSGSSDSSSRCNSVISGSNSDSRCSNFAGNRRCCCCWVVNDAGLFVILPSVRAGSRLLSSVPPRFYLLGSVPFVTWILIFWRRVVPCRAVVVVVMAGPGTLRLTLLGRASIEIPISLSHRIRNSEPIL